MKTEAQLKYAKAVGVKMTTLDSLEELEKIALHFPEADCLVRIVTTTTAARYNLNEKFGAEMSQVPAILELAKKLNVRMRGVAFHTGSGGVFAESYVESIKNARKVFDIAQGLGMEPMDLLDLGGGYTLLKPNTGKNFEEVAPEINKALDEYFPDSSTRIIAEPGTYVCENVSSLLCKVIGKKITSTGLINYYINNGLYQGYMILKFGEDVLLEPIDKKVASRPKKLCNIWGQTCDSCDYVKKQVEFPELNIGDWLITMQHGAYHEVLSNQFNGFDLPASINFN